MGQVEEANKALAQEMLDALTRNDVDWVRDHYAEDVRLWVTGTLPFSGEQGKAGAIESMPAVLDLFPKGLVFSLDSMVAEGESVAIEASSRGETFRGEMYEQEYHFLMKARDGKIIEWKEYMDTEHARKVLVGE